MVDYTGRRRNYCHVRIWSFCNAACCNFCANIYSWRKDSLGFLFKIKMFLMFKNKRIRKKLIYISSYCLGFAAGLWDLKGEIISSCGTGSIPSWRSRDVESHSRNHWEHPNTRNSCEDITLLCFWFCPLADEETAPHAGPQGCGKQHRTSLTLHLQPGSAPAPCRAWCAAPCALPQVLRGVGRQATPAGLVPEPGVGQPYLTL